MQDALPVLNFFELQYIKLLTVIPIKINEGHGQFYSNSTPLIEKELILQFLVLPNPGPLRFLRTVNQDPGLKYDLLSIMLPSNSENQTDALSFSAHLTSLLETVWLISV